MTQVSITIPNIASFAMPGGPPNAKIQRPCSHGKTENVTANQQVQISLDKRNAHPRSLSIVPILVPEELYQ